jgi:hypothetical protein
MWHVYQSWVSDDGLDYEWWNAGPDASTILGGIFQCPYAYTYGTKNFRTLHVPVVVNAVIYGIRVIRIKLIIYH